MLNRFLSKEKIEISWLFFRTGLSHTLQKCFGKIGISLDGTGNPGEVRIFSTQHFARFAGRDYIKVRCTRCDRSGNEKTTSSLLSFSDHF